MVSIQRNVKSHVHSAHLYCRSWVQLLLQRYSNKYSMSSDPGFTSFVKSILPPPPDIRKVVLQNISNKGDVTTIHTPHKPREASAKKMEISALNTTLVGDYIASVFPEYSSKWLVQAQGNATFASVVEAIQQDVVTVDRRYVFFQLGGNQIRSADAHNTFNNVLNLVAMVRNRKADSRIYFIAVLPRPVENDQVKVLVMKSNRWISHAVERVNNMMGRVTFLPVQLKFLNGSQPRMEFFHADDRLTLNTAGALMFKEEVFKLAGFVRNN